MKLVSVDAGSADHFGLCLSTFTFILVIFLVRLSIILKYSKPPLAVTSVNLP